VKRNYPNRFVALLAAMVFLLSGAGEAFGLHACPLHDPASAAHGHAGPEGAEAAGTSAHEHHGTSDAPEEAGHGPCTCKGACPTAGPGAVAVYTTVGFAVRIVAAPSVVVSSADLALPGITAFLVPNAQAPPHIG